MEKHDLSQRAFSLVELVLVIMIIGIITAMSVPRVFGLIESISEKAVSERLIEDLSYIRNYAIANHDTTWLVISVAQNQYGLFVGPSSGSRTLIPDPQTGVSAVVDLDDDYDNVIISSANFGGGPEVSFNFWGVPANGGTIVLNNNRTVTLVAETGMVHEAP